VSPGLPKCFQQVFFCRSLCRVIVGEVADTLRWREICTGKQQLEVLCPHILWWVQVLPEAYRSLLFSALCFSFADPGRREFSKREKEKKEKTK
jgi:hypothetical protein